MAAKLDPPPKIESQILWDWLRRLWLNTNLGTSSVSSVGLAAPNIFSVTGSPVTTSGTLTLVLTGQSNNTVFAGPISGGPSGPTFRVLDISDVPHTRLAKSVAGSVDVTLSTAEALNTILEFTGALTGSINVIVPTTVRQWTIFNNTSGAFTLTVKTSSGTGITVGQGKRAILYSDGTNVVRVTADA